MNIKYRVISTDEKDHTFVVRYYTDIITEEDLNVVFDIDGDIVYDSNGYPLNCRTDSTITFFQQSDSTFENVQRRIISSAPVTWLEKWEKQKLNVESGISMSSVNNLLGKEFSTTKEEINDSLIDTSNVYNLDESIKLFIANTVTDFLNKNVSNK